MEDLAYGREAAILGLLGLNPSHAGDQVGLVDEDELLGVSERSDDECCQPHGAGAVRVTEGRVGLVVMAVCELPLIACNK